MHFRLVDQILECGPDRAVTVKNVTLAEEYLQDHFPGFHVLPGVFMLEALVQSARLVLEARDRAKGDGVPRRMVLGEFALFGMATSCDLAKVCAAK